MKLPQKQALADIIMGMKKMRLDKMKGFKDKKQIIEIEEEEDDDDEEEEED